MDYSPRIFRPKRVDPLTMGPVIYPTDQEHWQQPIWGTPVRIAHGVGSKTDPLRKRGRRKIGISDETVSEPDGTRGSSFEEYLYLLRSCWRAGWSPEQALHLLEVDLLISDRSIGAPAQHAWQMIRRGDDWAQSVWHDLVIEGEQEPYYLRQIKPHLFSSNSPTGGAITASIQESPEVITDHETGEVSKVVQPGGFEIHEEKLRHLRGWLEVNGSPDLSQGDLVLRQWVIHAKRRHQSGVVIAYLNELKRRGLADFDLIRGGRGRPRKVWRVVLSPAEIAERDQAEAARRDAMAEPVPDFLPEDGSLWTQFTEEG